MNLEKFEQVCKKSQMKIVHREDTHGMCIFIADGLKPAGEKDLKLVRRTAYALGFNPDNLLIAQTIDFDKDLVENMRVENRVKFTLDKAKETAQMFKDARVRQEKEGFRVH